MRNEIQVHDQINPILFYKANKITILKFFVLNSGRQSTVKFLSSSGNSACAKGEGIVHQTPKSACWVPCCVKIKCFVSLILVEHAMVYQFGAAAAVAGLAFLGSLLQGVWRSAFSM